jgi:hypothetical protein
MTLLEKIQKHIPNCTQDHLNAALADAELTEEKVEQSSGLMGSIVGRLKKTVPGGLATQGTSISAKTKTPQQTIVSATVPTPTTAPIASVSTPVASESGDRDWATFNVRDLATLSKTELQSFKAYRQEELERQALINEILGLEAQSLDTEAANLQAQTQTQTSHRMVESDRAAFEIASQSGEELIQLARAAGKQSVEDQLSRDRAALEEIVRVGKQTPTQGEVQLAQAHGLRRRRMNALVGTENQWEQEVTRSLPAAQETMVTIDA